MTTVAVLGSTGSIGTQTLDVIARLPDRFRVRSLAAATDADGVAAQAKATGAERAAMLDPAAATRLRELAPSLEVLEGAEGVVELAGDKGADVVCNAIVGSGGLRATLAALDAGRRVALANKESCVAGGPLVAKRLAAGGELVPVDSEHAATHMCLVGERSRATKLVLTASGGPFRGRTLEDLEGVTVADALRHPTWEMGAKITVDSATLMNKGFEVIEANVLFGFDWNEIDVVCHPQSIVHCLVGFADGSWKASLAPPDMRVPIAYALGSPERLAWGAEDVDWSRMPALDFEDVDRKTFRCVELAYEAGRAGGVAPAVLNAANEAAVAAFLVERLPFLGIASTIERVLADGEETLGYGRDEIDLDDVMRADAWARERTAEAISRIG